MARRTYHNAARNPEEPARADPEEKPSVAARSWEWAKWGLGIAAGAVIGAYVTDLYRKYTGQTRNHDEEEGAPTPWQQQALPGGPSIMPFPIPMPFPTAYPAMPYPPQQMPGGYRDKRPLTAQQELELARLQAERAKHEAQAAQWGAFIEED